MTFTKNFKLILSSLIILFVSISSMLGVFIFYSFQEEPLNFILTSSITLEIDQTKTISYNVNFKDAEITFLIADPNIANIDGNEITGLAEDTTTLRATALYNGQIQYSSCEVIVEPRPALNFNFNITPLVDCSYIDETLYMANNTASFKLEIFDNSNNKIDISDIDHSCTCDISLSKQMDIIIVTANDEGYVEFKVQNTDFIFSLPIKKF